MDNEINKKLAILKNKSPANYRLISDMVSEKFYQKKQVEINKILDKLLSKCSEKDVTTTINRPKILNRLTPDEFFAIEHMSDEDKKIALNIIDNINNYFHDDFSYFCKYFSNADNKKIMKNILQITKEFGSNLIRDIWILSRHLYNIANPHLGELSLDKIICLQHRIYCFFMYCEQSNISIIFSDEKIIDLEKYEEDKYINVNVCLILDKVNSIITADTFKSKDINTKNIFLSTKEYFEIYLTDELSSATGKVFSRTNMDVALDFIKNNGIEIYWNNKNSQAYLSTQVWPIYEKISSSPASIETFSSKL